VSHTDEKDASLCPLDLRAGRTTENKEVGPVIRNQDKAADRTIQGCRPNTIVECQCHVDL
jgi:hypothetical protein